MPLGQSRLVLKGLMETHTFHSPVEPVELTAAEKAELASAWDGKIYSLSARRCHYLLLRLDSFLSDGATTHDPSVLTIEHVLPQTVNANSEWAQVWPDPHIRDEWVHRLVNLVPLNKSRNSQAQNFDFEQKKNAYFRGRNNVSSYALTSQVLSEPALTQEVVQRRQGELLEVLAERWCLK